MRYFVYFSYNGTNYHGSQSQPNAITVQQVMEKAFSLLLKDNITLTFAGRTDAGVHAEMMVAHFDYQSTFDATNLVNRLNKFLPQDIAIQLICPVIPTAHARYDAVSRRYEYRCTINKTPFYNQLSTIIPADIDVDAMNQAAQLLLRTNDFASFCKLHTDVKTTICKVVRAQWIQKDNMLVFEIEADRFLRNMVRAIVGTILDVGRHKLTLQQFQDIILACHRTAAGQSAPAQALFLVNIDYPKSLFINE